MSVYWLVLALALKTSPSITARETAARAVDGRWVFTIEEPLLAAPKPGESGANVLWRVKRALRDLSVYDARAPPIVVDGRNILGAAALVLDEAEVTHLPRHLERALPLP